MPYSRGPDPSPSFRFHVEIDGIDVGRFNEVGGLDFEAETIEYKEGGQNSIVHRFPGRYKSPNLTLKKGIATDGETLWTWVENTMKGQIATHDVTITLYDAEGNEPLRTWVFKGAFPVKWIAGALTAEQSAIAVETLSLAHQGLSTCQ